MLFFKTQNSLRYQQIYFMKEIYYKLFKILVIFLKANSQLGKLLISKKKSIFFKNTCIFSSRAKSISQKLKLSRIMIREIASKGFFFGLHKLSW